MQFKRGWLQTHKERGIDIDPGSIIFSANSSNGGREIASILMEERPETTAAFIAHDDTAMGFISGLLPFGRRVGLDFGIITYGGTRMHSFINPPLSAFTFPHFRTGQSLAKLLVKLIEGENPKHLQEVSTAEFLDLGSHIRQQ
jgi:LacI family transcriptional regulator